MGRAACALGLGLALWAAAPAPAQDPAPMIDVMTNWTQAYTLWATRLFLLSTGGIVIAFAILLAWRRRTALADQRRYATELVDSIPMGLILLSPSQIVEFANVRAQTKKIDGQPALEPGASYAEVVRDLMAAGYYDLGDVSPAAYLVRKTGPELADGYTGEVRLADGRTLARSVLKLKGGGILIQHQDVTEDRRRMSEIEALNAQLKISNDELRSFAYATSHDLKSPLNTAALLLGALRDTVTTKLSEEEAEIFDDLQLTHARASQMIEDVLAYTRTVGATPARQQTDLTVVVHDAWLALRADNLAAGGEITIDRLPQVNANRTQMEQLAQNLLGNAIKFRDPDRPLHIHVGPAPCGFFVADNGIGIAPEHQDKVFSLFSRLHAYGEIAGTGLGLAICQRIVSNHNGTLTLHSAPGVGSRFTVTIGAETDSAQSAA